MSGRDPERRRSPRRRPTRSTCWLTGEGLAEPAVLEDVSDGGVGLFLRHPVQPGWVVALELLGGSSRARSSYTLVVAHCRPEPDGYFAGCQFLEAADGPRFRALVGADD